MSTPQQEQSHAVLVEVARETLRGYGIMPRCVVCGAQRPDLVVWSLLSRISVTAVFYCPGDHAGVDVPALYVELTRQSALHGTSFAPSYAPHQLDTLPRPD